MHMTGDREPVNDRYIVLFSTVPLFHLQPGFAQTLAVFDFSETINIIKRVADICVLIVLKQIITMTTALL